MAGNITARYNDIVARHIADRVMDSNSEERKMAETIVGCKFEDMTKIQRGLVVVCMACAEDSLKKGKDGNR